MKALLITPVATALLLLAPMSGAALAAPPVPCEKKLRQLEDALKAANIADDVKARATALQNKGIERCKADDDARADGFFDDALRLVTK